MGKQALLLFESMDARDLIEIAILSLGIYVVLRFLRQTRGAGVVRGLGLIGVGLFLVAQLLIARFELTELGRILDYLLTTIVLAVLVIFQPELRRGLMLLGRYRGIRVFATPEEPTVPERLANLALALSRDRVGALIAVQREQSLAQFIETGERVDSEISQPLLRALFAHSSPLHDGAVVICSGRIIAAACQLPLGQPIADGPRTGMRHRAAIGLSEETDAVVLVVSEETGRISVAVGGSLEIVPRENIARRLMAELSPPPTTEKVRRMRIRVVRLIWKSRTAA